MSTFDQFYIGMVIAGMAALFFTLAWAVLYTRKTPSAPAASQQPPAESEPERKLAA